MNNFKFLISFSFIFIFTSYFFSQQQNNLQNQGNVGIGTTTPSKSFEVVGESEIHGKLSIDSSLLVKDTASFERNVSFSEKVDVTGEGKFRDNLRVYGGLEVVGPTMLYDNLQVGKKVFFNNVNTLNTIENEGFLIIDSTGLVHKGGLKTFKSLIYQPRLCNTDVNGDITNPTWKNGLNKIFIDCPEVNVAIGNSNPQSRLHVSGKIRSSSIDAGHFTGVTATVNGFRNGPQDASSSIARFGRRLNNDVFTYFDLRMDGTLRMQNENREVFVVNMDEETVFARRIRIDLENWADFVFEKDYKLKPLPELESFINNNGHLPEIPSEKVMVEEGLDLAEMNKLLLQKIEELTLYLIEQNEKTENLSKEIEELKIKIQEFN